jgi:hypothetical protein
MVSIPFRFAHADADLVAPDAPGAVTGRSTAIRRVKRRFAAVSAAAALCALASGCAGDPGAQATSQSSGQLRYYGGPKYPMWQTQEVRQ